jgi:amidophosphoribosyltransferase
VVELAPEGYRQVRKPNERMQICSFLWVYFGYPPSFYEDVNVDDTRYKCGASLASNDDIRADFVAGIPDSGIGHAIGYSNAKQIPLKRPYAKYTPTWPRSFMPQNQETRDLVAKMKLIPNQSVIKGKCGIFLDDSIVRGTQLKDNVQHLHAGGIKEVHMRIACPPLVHACEFLNFSRSKSIYDLATRRVIKQLEGSEDVDVKDYTDETTDKYGAMVEKIRKNLGLTSLKYQKLSDLVEAIGLPKQKLCTHCWDGTSGY